MMRVPIHLFAVASFIFMLLNSSEAQTPTVDEVLASAKQSGNSERGLHVFASAKFACVSCHAVGESGGKIGPALSQIAKQRKPTEIVESLLTPKKSVQPEFIAHAVQTEDGQQYRGYLVRETNEELVLRDPSSERLEHIPVDSIEARKEIGTLMPEGLSQAMSPQELADVVHFLLNLKNDGDIDRKLAESVLKHAASHNHGPAVFEYELGPLAPEDRPNANHFVNRERVYDYYAKQAAAFRGRSDSVRLLPEFPGLDGGTLGHWGNQDEETWRDGRWNDTELGTLQSGVFRGAGVQVDRGICIRFGENQQYSACFNPEDLSYSLVWENGFVKFSDTRHGFVSGLALDGKPISRDVSALSSELPEHNKRRYLGLYRSGDLVAFRYRIGDQEFLDVPKVIDGKFQPEALPIEDHPLRSILNGGQAQWPEVITTPIELGDQSPYAIDTITPPFDNPWNSLMFFGGHAFLPDGSALLCTMQGDVWHVSDISAPSTQAHWKRFASGLHQPQGIVVDEDGIFVLGRDQITRLHDLNGDNEADYYEAFSTAFETSPAGHDFICGLERDADGYFYTASGNQGLLRISPNGEHVEVLATGFRNPDGLGVTSDGKVTVPCSEGTWTPASMICSVPVHEKPAQLHPGIGGQDPPFYGYQGPKDGQAPELPLVYLPRGIDNSSGGQIEISSDSWGPLRDEMVHLSFGTGSHFLLLRDEVRGVEQGTIVPLPGEFLSGAHRGRFHPLDGQLYVTGMAGWGAYSIEDGCFQRVRYTGDSVQLPVSVSAHENGIHVQFSAPIDPSTAKDRADQFAQAWNYRYSPGYGSPEFSTKDYGTRGHDVLTITRVQTTDDGHGLFLEIPELQPVNQLHLSLAPDADHRCELFLTIHALHEPWTIPGENPPIRKDVSPPPVLKDLAYATQLKPNPWNRRLKNAREIELATGSNLSFQDRTLRVKAGEPIRFTLRNPDVVPHNWAFVKPGALHAVGTMSNKLIADPDAFLSHYIPETDDVLVHTDVVSPGSFQVIFFHAPKTPGVYPYLCTFPGHWLVMNGELIVE
ncbi:plastocyanin/azurin family copper-binding protein [Thalassoglobus neptunius]|nr:plastocyanin/azurin family copper-binding protein [Thalassoglobus neptunius]